MSTSVALARPQPVVEMAQQMKPSRLVTYKTVAGRELSLHVFAPANFDPSQRRPAYVTFHGGGWTSRDPSYFYPFAQHFAQLGMVGISVEYRLITVRQKGPKPGDASVFDCVRDARSAIRYLRAHADELGIDPQRIAVTGGSAGGHLAVGAALFTGVDEPGEDVTISCMPNALVLYYPVIDTSADGYGQAKIGARWRELSPVDQVKPQLPPTLVLHGDNDKVTPHAGAVRFVELMQQAGNDCQLITHPGGGHGYFLYDLTLFQQAMDLTADFLRKHGLLDAPR